MIKKTITNKVMYKIVNGKQPQTVKLKDGYINLLPREELSFSENSLTEDVTSKERRGYIKLERINFPVETVVEEEIKPVVK